MGRMAVSVSAAVLSLHTSLRGLVAYVAPTLRLSLPDKRNLRNVQK